MNGYQRRRYIGHCKYSDVGAAGAVGAAADSVGSDVSGSARFILLILPLPLPPLPLLLPLLLLPPLRSSQHPPSEGAVICKRLPRILGMCPHINAHAPQPSRSVVIEDSPANSSSSSAVSSSSSAISSRGAEVRQCGGILALLQQCSPKPVRHLHVRWIKPLRPLQVRHCGRIAGGPLGGHEKH
jgi:hypothetical protein